MRLTSYIEFDVLIHFEIPRHQSVLKNISWNGRLFDLYSSLVSKRSYFRSILLCKHFYNQVTIKKIRIL